ncbi:hypothetical protein ElyMa_004345400 [Elysia marginata]|uniref:Secreted protein n=1 Tax=Elysia marginata TaxID=1093978 RepID=A0AAV4H4Y4_9GAST|nr:hypothetical protein ElyMa_004345400 [Elysia marginata]
MPGPLLHVWRMLFASLTRSLLMSECNRDRTCNKGDSNNSSRSSRSSSSSSSSNSSNNNISNTDIKGNSTEVLNKDHPLV